MSRLLAIPVHKKQSWWFELGVIAIALSLLAGILLDRLWFYQEAYEKAMMEYQITEFRSALRLRMADLMIQGRMRDIASLASENPVDWLPQKPANYEPVFPASASKIKTATWYYDATAKVLRYYPHNARYFDAGDTAEKQVKLKVELIFNQRAETNPDEPRVLGATVVVINPYHWL